MKRYKKILTTMLTACMILGLTAADALAAEKYTYTVTFYAGNQGSFTGTAGLSVIGSGYAVEQTEDQIRVSGLNQGDIVSFDTQAGAVGVGESGKYYVKGVRLSGRDNSEAQASSFRVSADEDYVVAYGVKGNLVSYTVRYQDENGNELADSQTYYGNVGDKPVVAYRYLENYSPQALALTKTLSSNEAENVFTFVYRPGELQVVTVPGETITETTVVPGTGTAGTTTGGTTGTAGTGTDNVGTGNAGAGTGTGAGAGTAGAADGETANAGSPVLPETEGNEETEGTQDIVDLDEEETPLGNLDMGEDEKEDKSEEVKKGLPLAGGIAIGAGAVVALALLVILVRRRMR